MGSASRHMVFNICVKFHENKSRGFKVMERTRKLLTDKDRQTDTQKRKKLYNPWHTLYARGQSWQESNSADNSLKRNQGVTEKSQRKPNLI